MNNNTDYFDIRDLLRVVNGIIVFLLLLAYPLSHSSDYLNEFTIFLGCALALQTHIGLSKKSGAIDPLAVILLYYVIVYYTLRIVTLAVFDSSDVFRRFEYTAEDTNFALVFILIGNACLLLGFRLGGKAVQQFVRKEFSQDILHVLKPLLWMLALSVAANVFGLLDWIADQSRLLRTLVFFIRPTTWLLVVGVIFVVYYKEIPRLYFGIYVSIYCVFVLYLTIGGSRGAIIYIIEMFAILLLRNEKYKISKKILYKSMFYGPALTVVLVVTYNFASLQRNVTENSPGSGIERVWKNFYVAITDGDGVNDAKNNIGLIFSRVGFLDMASEIIAHKSEYDSIFNATYYAMSAIDNVLTPGFDYFDAPKVSYALVFKHQGYNGGNPSKLYLKESNIYHSDQVTIYGELYALFGWWSLMAFFILAYILKWVYCNCLISHHHYGEVLRRLVVLYFFVLLINSFGVDWIVVQMLPLALTAFSVFAYYRGVSRQTRR